MKTIHDILRERILAGQVYQESKLDQLRRTEWSPEFEQLMRNRLITGCWRYGPFRKQNRTTQQIVQSIIYRTVEYAHDGNLEHLVDVANLAMKEYVTGNHPNRHFRALDESKHV
jgi:hypothetical protein